MRCFLWCYAGRERSMHWDEVLHCVVGSGTLRVTPEGRHSAWMGAF
jgi:hypothetical protein